MHAEGQFTPNIFSKLALLCASMLMLMGAAAVAPALNSIEAEFGAGKMVTSLVITLPALAVAVSSLFIGRLSDRIGKAKIFNVSLAIFLVSGVAGYFATSITMLLAMRFILGIGLAGITVSSNALIGMYYSGQELRNVIALQGAFMGIGCFFLEAGGGFLTDMSWNITFLIYFIGLPILIFGLLGIREWAHPVDMNMVGSSEPMEKETDMKYVIFLYATVFIVMFCMFVAPTNMSDYLVGQDVSMLICGAILGLMGVAQAVGAMALGKVKKRPHECTLYGISGLLLAAGFLLLLTKNIPLEMLALFLIGIGMGFAMPTIIASLTAAANSRNRGLVMGGYSTVLNLGTFFSAIVMTAVITGAGNDLGFGFTVTAVLLVIMAALQFACSAAAHRKK